MLETFILSFTAFFATVGPIDVAIVYAALTGRVTAAAKKSMAIRGVAVAGLILFSFAVFGQLLLDNLGISLAALRTAGGILLTLIGIDMVFARHSGGVSTTETEESEARGKNDIAVFPLATPLIAGAGSMGAAILLMAETEGDFSLQLMVLGALAAVLILTLVALIGAIKIHRIMGVVGMNVVSRVFGVILTALAVQFIFDGLAESGLF
jgi:multiple antibiotic resistance protein